MWRDRAGDVHVWEDLCIHRGSRLSKGCIVDDTVVCPYHGWRYDGCGDVRADSRDAAPAAADESAGDSLSVRRAIRLRLGLARHPGRRHSASFGEWSDDSYIKVHAGPYLWKASGFRAVENFLDATHFPFVHAGVNGVETSPRRDRRLRGRARTTDGLHTSEVRVFQPYGDPRDVPVHAGYSYRCMRPLVALLLEARCRWPTRRLRTSAFRPTASAPTSRRRRSTTRAASFASARPETSAPS